MLVAVVYTETDYGRNYDELYSCTCWDPPQTLGKSQLGVLYSHWQGTKQKSNVQN